MAVEISDDILGRRPVDIHDAGGRLLPQAIRRAQMLRLALRGVNAKRASEIMSCSYATAREVYSDPGFRKACLGRLDDAFTDTDAAFAEKKKSLVERLEEKAEVAFEILCDMLETPETSAGHRIRIAQDLLNRHSETAPIQRAQFRLDPIELVHAAKVAREMDAENVVQFPKQLSA